MPDILTRAAAPLAMLALAGCTWNARPVQMAAPATAPAAVPPSLASAIDVGAVEGGRETWQLYVTAVDTDRIADAVRRSLAARTLLAARDPRYRLRVSLDEWRQPTFGDDLTVAVTLSCRLEAPDAPRPHWEATHPATFTAPRAAAADGGARLRLANEGAVRQGLGACLDDLAAVAEAEPARFAPGAPPPELPLDPTSMAVLRPATPLPAESRLRQGVQLGAVVVDRAARPLGPDMIAEDNLREALRLSLDAHGMLAPDGAGARLDATLTALRQPPDGDPAPTVEATVRYRLTTPGGAVLFQRDLRRTSTASLGVPDAGATPIRVANAGAVGATIAALIAALTQETRGPGPRPVAAARP